MIIYRARNWCIFKNHKWSKKRERTDNAEADDSVADENDYDDSGLRIRNHRLPQAVSELERERVVSTKL